MHHALAAIISVGWFGKVLAKHQWRGVLLLTTGLLLNGLGAAGEAAASGHAQFVEVGVLLVVIGTVFHAAFWVSAEVRLLKEKKLLPIAIPLVMGVLQAVVLIVWNVICYLMWVVFLLLCAAS